MINWDNIIETILGLLLGAAVCLMFCALGGCSTAKPVVVERVVTKTDTLYKTNARADTLRILDSVFVNQYSKGDTVYKEKTTWKWRDKVSVRVDTIYKVALQTDSVRIPMSVKRKLSTWEQTQMWVGKISICIVGFALLTLLIWLIHRKR